MQYRPGRNPAGAVEHVTKRIFDTITLCELSFAQRSDCQKSLAEFAPAGANKVLTIFSGDMCVGKNPSRLANVHSKSVRCGEPRSPQMGEPRRALPFEYKKGAPEGAPPPQCRRGQIRTCTTRQVGRRPIASALPTSGKKPGGLQFTAGDRRPLYLMWV